MSLPDAPNTLREKYYSVMAGQNDADILPDIETAPSTENRYLDYIARNGGGGGGDVSGVKGDAETTYRTGNVNLTAANVGAYTTAQTNTLLDGKVDKVQGKGLSTEDYTTAEKTKLGTVETNATANTVINTSCTLAANGWTGASAPYTQTVNVANILATDRAYVDLSVSSTTATGIDEIENWAYISKVESGTGTLTFTCYEDKPDIDLNVNVQVVRGTNTGGGSPVETVLYNNVNLAIVGVVNVTQDLSQPYTNFDEVRVEYAYVYTPTAGNNKIYPIINTYTVDELEAMRTSLYAGRKGYILFISISDMYIALDITTTSQFTVIDVRNSSSYNQYITKITGIKY